MVWWVPHTLKKCDRIISKLVLRKRKETHEYGIEVPRNVHHALELDRDNRKSLWANAIRKVISGLSLAFDIRDKDTSVESAREYLECYTIFDVKMDFTQKARFVANGAH